MKVLIVAENPLARMGLAALLAGQTDLNVVGQSSGQNVAADVEQSAAEVIVWDWGWESTPKLPPGTPVVALLKQADQTAEAWAAGARGLLLGNTSADGLSVAVRAVAEGLTVLEPALTAALLVTPVVSEPPADALTPREMDVLQLLAEGLANKIIAQRLMITDHTVKFHVNAIMSKLGVQSRTEAVVRATKLGYIIL
jgi:two-component system nitrate/nitrite response regulator NarL